MFVYSKPHMLVWLHRNSITLGHFEVARETASTVNVNDGSFFGLFRDRGEYFYMTEERNLASSTGTRVNALPV
jgi:hypothetical protein